MPKKKDEGNVKVQGQSLSNLRDLFIHELMDIYSAEKLINEAMPRLAEAATDPALKKMFKDHINETENQANRIEQIFSTLGLKPKVTECQGMRGIIREAQELVSLEAAPEVRDAGLIAMAQRIEHYEIAACGTARTYASFLDEKWSADQLQTTLDEENRTDRELTEMAVRVINAKAR